MIKGQGQLGLVIPENRMAKSGYQFKVSHDYWQLDKNVKVAVGEVCKLLHDDMVYGYLETLSYYAENNSAAHIKNINERTLRFLRTTKSSFNHIPSLINYRASSNDRTEWYLGVIRGFLKKWHELGYPGISDDVVDLLNSWTIKGNVKGDVVKRLDPIQGPLTDVELQGFNEGAVRAFESGSISLTEMALGLLVSNTGRRPIQISHLRIKDVLKGSNKRGDETYLLNIPRAKQRASSFRGEFKQFSITKDLWIILNAQSIYAAKSITAAIGFELPQAIMIEMPLFPDLKALSGSVSLICIKNSLDTDVLHMKSLKVTNVCKKISERANLNSERTGEPLKISSNRFRYTTGTRAAREGFGSMVIAELLDHSDNQNSSVYVENIPEHVERLDEAVGHQMAQYAQAFSGVLVGEESKAKRGNDINSRVKASGQAVGNCGSYGFCGANVPIPCYTCMHFQPWLDGPHDAVYADLISERTRLLDLTNDMQVAAINDRSILAVADVIQQCNIRKGQVKNG